MDEILHTVAREAKSELDLDSMRGSISAEYKKRLKTRNTAMRWVSAAAAVIVFAGVGIFANRNPMRNMAPKAEERMDSFAAEAPPEGSAGLAGEGGILEAPEAPAVKAPEQEAELPETQSEPYDQAYRGGVSSSEVIDAGLRSSLAGSGADIAPKALPNGWSVTETDDGWTASLESGASLECRRIDQVTLTDRTNGLKMKQLALGQAVLVIYNDGSSELFYRAAEGTELYFSGKGVGRDTLLGIALSVGESAE
jgi:hypothetical protein